MTRPICTFLSGLACLAAPAAMADDVTIALDWTLNTNHIGLVVAQELGYFDDAGLEVEILPYSDSASTALLAAGVVDFAYMTALGFMSAKAADAPITALWVTMQHEAGRLVYNSDNPEITRPADLEGKTYAGFGSAWEDALITTMIENDGGTPDYDTVTLGTGAYEALASGAVDFTLEVATWAFRLQRLRCAGTPRRLYRHAHRNPGRRPGACVRLHGGDATGLRMGGGQPGRGSRDPDPGGRFPERGARARLDACHRRRRLSDRRLDAGG